MSDSSQGGTNPPQNPYGGQTPSGPAPGQDPDGQPPAGNPYGQPPAGNPYGGQAPYAPQPQPQPYGQPAQPQQPYGAPYGQAPQPGPLGDGRDMYGRPLAKEARPGTVTAAGWTTLVLSGLTALLFGFFTVAMIVAKDDMIEEIDRALARCGCDRRLQCRGRLRPRPGVMLVLTVWCVIACVLASSRCAAPTSRGSSSSSPPAWPGCSACFAIGSVVSAVWLLACIAVVVLLFTGGAGGWYARRRGY